MKNSPFDIGFRVVGHKAARRRPIRHAAAFAAYAECDPLAEVEREAYLSYFVFDRPFVEYVKRNDSEAAYDGPCGAPWLWWDVDRTNDLRAALIDARRLCGSVLDRYREFDDDDLLIFLSGGKGVHVGLKTVWHPEPSPGFNAVAKVFCLDLAESARVVVDGSIFSKTRLFRAPNSRHPKTGLFKRRLSLEDITYLTPEAVVDLARHPEPFDIPTGPAVCPRVAEDWDKARWAVERRAVERQATPRDGAAKLTAFARRFIRDGELDELKREVSTFRVAAELSEMNLIHGFDRLLFALLEETALDSGLTPSEARHAIESGLSHARRQQEGGAS
jgi:hypothetical protein